MCKFCDLEALEAESFDAFFEGAASHGYRSMVCKHCSTTFFTQSSELQPATISTAFPHQSVHAGEQEMVMLPG
jgi:hypothetical protein